MTYVEESSELHGDPTKDINVLCDYAKNFVVISKDGAVHAR